MATEPDSYEAHTPGPWCVNPFTARVDCLQLDEDGDPLPVCQLLWPTEYRSEAETFANGSLIAAAPELLEQAKLFERCIVYQIKVAETKDDDEGARLQSMTLHLLREVIAKAEPQQVPA